MNEKTLIKDAKQVREHQLLTQVLDNPVFQLALAMVAVESMYYYETKIHPNKNWDGQVMLDNNRIPVHPLSDKMMAWSGWLILAKQMLPYTKELVPLASQGVGAVAKSAGGLTTAGVNALKALL